jgi:hypothetical protein
MSNERDIGDAIARVIIEVQPPTDDSAPRLCIYGVIVGADVPRVRSRTVCDLRGGQVQDLLDMLMVGRAGEVGGDLRHASRHTVLASLGALEVVP